MNFDEVESITGFRPVLNLFPNSKSMAQKVVMPLGVLYSPFMVQVEELKKGTFPSCAKCKASICKGDKADGNNNRNSNRWVCPFCSAENACAPGFGLETVEESYTGKYGECGLFFIVDQCVSEYEMQSIRDTMIKTIEQLPEYIFVGLITFNKNVNIANFEGEDLEYICFNGSESYDTIPQIAYVLGLNYSSLPTLSKFLTSKFYVPFNANKHKLIEAISELEADSHVVPRENRYKRASGAALQLAVNLICSTGIHTRFVTLIGGPCTIGPGRVVDLPLKNTIRVYMDILENNENAQYLKPATKFYETLAKKIIDAKCTMDIWAYGLDQFGLVYMRYMVNQSGGLMAMHEQFNHFIFQESFKRFYEPNYAGLFNFPFAATLRIRVTNNMKINGILGTCKSLKENTLKTAAYMEIGEGKTNYWYIGGISFTNMLCIMLSHSYLANSDNNQRGFYLQAITYYKYSDNVARTRVSTIFIPFVRYIQIKYIAKGFDEQAAAVMLARMASKKAEVYDITEVKKWIDRILLKFCVRFAQFNHGQRQSFKLIYMMKQFPQLMYHLRRSGLVNPFGCPPDQSIYMKTCLERESLPNCIVMIQSALLKYEADVVDYEGRCYPQPVELDFQEMKEDAVLLMDSYFNVIVWFGDNIKAWKYQKLNETYGYEYLTELFEAPLRDASEIIYDRIPVSNFYETFKNDGKERYLKARVNPSTSNQQYSDGHFVTDDAPINIFMDFLIKSVVNYLE